MITTSNKIESVVSSSFLKSSKEAFIFIYHTELSEINSYFYNVSRIIRASCITIYCNVIIQYCPPCSIWHFPLLIDNTHLFSHLTLINFNILSLCSCNQAKPSKRNEEIQSKQQNLQKASGVILVMRNGL